jgi:hypothetical protein
MMGEEESYLRLPGSIAALRPTHPPNNIRHAKAVVADTKKDRCRFARKDREEAEPRFQIE